ncbi:MAG TPA: hypothetical protein VKU19_33605 [Bryobacteraceae bacterium]|nr:hypothetical protein [Bryobacteraceae bacterium]
MKPLPVLDVDLVIEHGGRKLHLQGSGKRFAVTFPSLVSLLHFAPILWPYRKRIPRPASLHVEWRGLRISVR